MGGLMLRRLSAGSASCDAVKLPAKCSACGGGIIMCTIDTSQQPCLSGVARCLTCGDSQAFSLVPPTVKLPTIRVKGAPVPERGACPECDSLNVGIVGRCEENEDDSWLEFECLDCKYMLGLSGSNARVALNVLQAAGPEEFVRDFDPALN